MAIQRGVIAVLLLGACMAASAQYVEQVTPRGPAAGSLNGPPLISTPIGGSGPEGTVGPARPAPMFGGNPFAAPKAAAPKDAAPADDAADDAAPKGAAPKGAAPKAAPEPSLRGGVLVTAPDDYKPDGVSIAVGPEPKFDGTLFDGRTAAARKAAGPPAELPPPITYTITNPPVELNQATDKPPVAAPPKPQMFRVEVPAAPKDAAPKDAAPKDAAPKDAAPKAASPKA